MARAGVGTGSRGCGRIGSVDAHGHERGPLVVGDTLACVLGNYLAPGCDRLRSTRGERSASAISDGIDRGLASGFAIAFAKEAREPERETTIGSPEYGALEAMNRHTHADFTAQLKDFSHQIERIDRHPFPSSEILSAAQPPISAAQPSRSEPRCGSDREPGPHGRG